MLYKAIEEVKMIGEGNRTESHARDGIDGDGKEKKGRKMI